MNKNIKLQPPQPQIMRPTPRKAAVGLSLGVILFILYSFARYLGDESQFIARYSLILLFLAIVSLLYSIYYLSNEMGKRQMFFYGVIGLSLGGGALIVYLNYHPPVVMEGGITLVILAIFLLFHAVLLMFTPKSQKNQRIGKTSVSDLPSEDLSETPSDFYFPE